jgi:polynucleotide 5'-hydroxyl-kinase GRC3/NOL9
MEIIPEPEWQILFNRLTECKGTSVIIGSTDSGKSTLVRYFIGRFISGNIKACLVDSDVGQSSLGLPGTISMKLFASEKDIEDFAFEKMSFVGTLNPARDIASIIKQTKGCRTSAGKNRIPHSWIPRGSFRGKRARH